MGSKPLVEATTISNVLPPRTRRRIAWTCQNGAPKKDVRGSDFVWFRTQADNHTTKQGNHTNARSVVRCSPCRCGKSKHPVRQQTSSMPRRTMPRRAPPFLKPWNLTRHRR